MREYDWSNDFEGSYQRLNRSYHWMNVATFIVVTVLVIADVILWTLRPFNWWLDLLHGGVVGTQIGLWLHRRRNMRAMRKIRAERQQLAAQMEVVGEQLAATMEQLHDEVFGDEIGPGHPLHALMMGVIERGGAEGNLIRTDDGWEVLNGRFFDGTEYGPHEPTHEERDG